MGDQHERLDQILIRLGFATDADISRALRQQSGLGGRIGAHLVYNGSVSEDQLAEALSIQTGAPPFRGDRDKVSVDLLKRFSVGMIREYEVLPLAHNPAAGVLTVVTTNPGHGHIVEALKKAVRCDHVEFRVTGEVTFAGLLEQHAPRARIPAVRPDTIALPDLFVADHDPVDLLREVDADAPTRHPVLIVSEQIALGHFLGPVFEREDAELTITSDPGEATDFLSDYPQADILVAPDLQSRYDAWVRAGDLPLPQGQVGVFTSVSGALTDNPVPYAAMFASLSGALQLLNETGVDASGILFPYDLLRRDVRSVGLALGLSHLAVDGLELAALSIAPGAPGTATVEIETAIDWNKTLHRCRALHFAWDIEAVLVAFRELLAEQVNLEEFSHTCRETALAAQVLGCVWYLHGVVLADSSGDGDHLRRARTHLRQKSGRLAHSEIIESCLELIVSDNGDTAAATGQQLFIVGDGARDLRPLSARLQRLGYRPVEISGLDEAQDMCRRCAPAAVFMQDDLLPTGVADARSLFTSEHRVLVYAIAGESDPSRLLNLFDLGCDDVFCLPHDLEIVPARLRKSLRDAGDRSGDGAAATGFRAGFAAFSFTDLLQTLNQSRKSVRIDLTGPAGEAAVMYMQDGQLIHAQCGDLVGPEAAYGVIAWEEAGEFAVESLAEFPAPNISAPLESILMEGCRILDESRV